MNAVTRILNCCSEKRWDVMGSVPQDILTIVQDVNTLRQKGLEVTGVIPATLMIEAFVTDLQLLVMCYRQRPVKRPW
jgi:hypothetical protein